MAGLRIGILVDTALKQHYLDTMVVQAGHSIGVSQVLDEGQPRQVMGQSVDAWVVDITESDGSYHADQRQLALLNMVDALLDQTEIPVIFNEGVCFEKGSLEQITWSRRMMQRLQRINGDINLRLNAPASEVWVLGASTGGPAAVKDFLAALPAQLNVGFVYVQHIDSPQAEPLIRMMTSAGHYPAHKAHQGAVIANNSLTLITADRSTSILDNGTLMLSSQAWSGFYAPSIDQVAANVARVYRQRSGLIIFTGMGDDGAASCRLIKQQGGTVWAQSPGSCTITSMPDAAIATQSVSFQGTPEELALAFAQMKMKADTHSKNAK